MGKIKKWRKIALALLTALMFLTLALAIVQVLPVNAAAEDGVLDGNTAEYTFENDKEHPWIYAGDENVWYNNADPNTEKNYLGDYLAFDKVLTVIITSPGDVVFQYKTNLFIRNNVFSNWSAVSNFYLELTKDGVTNTIIAKHGEKMADYEVFIVKNLSVGDKIVFKYQMTDESTPADDRVYIKGLRKPIGDSVTITATAEEHGTIVCGDDTNNQINESVLSGSLLTLTAKPDEGYVFAYWTKDGTETVYGDTLRLYPFEAANYTAHFVTNDYSKLTADGWDVLSEGKDFKISDATLMKKISTLTYEFVGEKHITFSLSQHFMSAGDSNGLTTYLNGKDGTESTEYAGDLPSITWQNNATPEINGYFVAIGEGYHRVDFVYAGIDRSDVFVTPSEPDRVEIKDFTVSDGYPGETTIIQLHYKENCGTVYINGVPTAPGDNVAIPKGVATTFTVAVNPTVVSPTDPSQQVAVKWEGFFTLPNTVAAFAPPPPTIPAGMFTDQQTFTLIFGNDDAVQPNGTPIYGDVIRGVRKQADDTYYIEARMSEQISMPQVGVSAIVDGLEEKEQEIENGGNYRIPYGKTVNLGVSMDDVPDVEETYHIKFNGEEQPDIQIVNNEGKNFFTLSNVTADTTVTIIRSAEGYLDSDEFTFTIEVVSDGGIKDILVDGAEGITIENDEYVPWKFSAELSGENGIAYMAGNSGLLSYYGIAVSTLKFHITGQGFLHFDFSVHKGAYWLLYSEEQPFSITDKVTKTDAEEAYFGSLYWINNTYGTWKNIIAYGSNDRSHNGYMEWPYGKNTDPETSKVTPYTWKTDYDGKKAYTFLEDGWAHVSIPVGEDGQEKDIYVSYYRDLCMSNYYDKDSESTKSYRDEAKGSKTSLQFASAEYCDYAAIRNVAFLKGNAKIDYAAVDAKGETASGGTAKAVFNEKDVANGGEIPIGSRITFTATENEGGQFYGWVTADGKLVSLDKEYSTAVYTSSYAIRAIFGTKGQYYLRNDGKYFEDLKTAIYGRDDKGTDKAQAGDALIVLRDGLKISESMELPAGISLVLPVDEKGADFHFGVAEDTKNNIKANSTPRVPWSSDELIARYKNFTLTVADGTTFTVKGTLAVGAIQHYPDQNAQGATSGKYNVLDIQGSVVVERGGHLDVRGLVTGKGGITVKSGGKLTQPFMILDFSGGTNTKALFNAGVTPFKMYGMVNIQCELGYTIEYGGALWGHASLFAMLGNQTLDTPFISTENDLLGSLLLLKKDAKVTVTYDDTHERPAMDDGNNAQDVGKTTMTVTGGATAGYMQFPMNIDTKNVYFSLPYNYELILRQGDYDVANNFKLMPGSVVRVEKGATLNVKEGKGLHVYDSFLGPHFVKREYPTSEQLTGADYKPYASLIVNGALNIEDGATFLGTVQTKDTTGTAKITVGDNVTLSQELFDGAATMYGCNYTSYTLTAQIYDDAHKGADGKGTMGKLQAGKTYISVAEGATGWTLPGITFTMETTTSPDGNHTHYKDKDHHDLNNVVTTESVTGMEGSWKADHTKCAFDWAQLSEKEKHLGDENFKALERQCTELGCSEHDHKLLIKSAAVAFSETYKGAAFTQGDVLKLFYRDVFGADTPGAYSYFKATVGQLNSGSSMQNANSYLGAVPITLENGWFDDVPTDEKTFDFEIKKFHVTNLDRNAIEKSLSGLVYTGEAQTPNLTLRADGLTGDVSHDTLKWNNNVKASDMGASVTITGSGDNFEGTLTINFSIAKAELSVTLEKASHVYGTDPVTPDVTLEGVKHNEETQIKAAITRTTSAGKWSPVGSEYTVTAAATEAEVLKNYKVNFTNNGAAIYEVTAKDITGVASVTAASVKYSGLEQKAALAITFAEYTKYFTENTDYTVSYKNGEEATPLNAGTYTVTLKGTGNYTGEITCEYVIEKAEVTVTVNQQKYTYNRESQSYVNSDGAWTAEGLVNNEGKIVLGVTITGSGTNVNTYSVECGYKQDGNYTVTEFIGMGNALVIAPATIGSVEVTSGALTYNGTDQTGKVTLTVKAGELALEDGEYTVTYSGEKYDGQVKNAGTYTVTVKASSTNFRDGGEDVAAQFTVARKKITVTANDMKGIYGDAKPEPKGFTVPNGALVGGDRQAVLTVTLTLQAVENDRYAVGQDYSIEGTGTADNYEITVNPGKYTVEKKQITVTADDITGTYGDAKPEPEKFTIPDDALEYGDPESVLDVTLTLATADKYVVNAEYLITGTGTADNYAITVTAGKYTVKAKEITVTINEQKVTYSAEKQSPTSIYNQDWTVTGLVEGDDYGVLGVTLSAEGACLNADSYPISGTATAVNYDVKFTDGSGKFVIEKKGITVRATNLNLPEGTTKESVEKQLAFTVTGLLNDSNDVKDHIKVTVAYEDGAEKGRTFAIKVAFEQGYDPQNYKVTAFIEGVLSIIDSKFKDVVFEGKSFEYNGELHTLTATNLPEGAKATYAYAEGERALGSDGVRNVGSYTVTLTVTLAGYQDYTKPVTLTITPKAITISADDVKDKVYGDALVQDDALTFTVPDGALASDDERSVLTVSLRWDHNRNVGEHPITGTATAENYTVTVTPGTYHIKAKKITVNILPQTWAIYNASVQRAQSAVSNWSVAEGALAWGESQTELKVTLTGSGTDAGSYKIEGESANANYDVTFEDGEEAFVIAQKDIANAEIGGLGGVFTYREAQWTPEVTVTLIGFGTLKITEDYTVAYGNNKTVEDGGEVTVTGTGNFTGTAKETFDIVPMSIEGLSITLLEPEMVIYNGEQQQPEYTVALEGFTNVDLLPATYGRNIEAGENAGSLTVQGKENFKGTVTFRFTIHARPVTVTVNKQTVTYNQQSQSAQSRNGTDWSVTNLAAHEEGTPGVLNVTLTATGEDAGTYDIEASWNNPNYAVTFAGDSDLKVENNRTVKGAFIIEAAELSGAQLTSTHTYSGSVQTPEFTVTAGALTVAKEDYKLTYAGNADRVSAGTVDVTVESDSGNYTGTVKTSFTIAQKQIKVTLQAQSFEYSGETPTPADEKYELNEDELCSKNGEKDDLGIDITLVDGNKDVGTYSLDATASNKDYEVLFDKTAKLSVTKKQITVKADDLTSTYGDDVKPLTYTAKGLVANEDPAKELKITLQTRTIKEEGTYPITGTGSATNYTFTVEAGTYTVEPKTITVTIVNKSSVYDGKKPVITSVQGTDWTVEDGAIEEGDDLMIKLTIQDIAADVRIDDDGEIIGYAITGGHTNHNYIVDWVDGTYTIQAREVTVEILDQRATYDYREEKQYAFDGTKWQVDAATLAPGEEKSVLGVTLTEPALSGAGTYEIKAVRSNTNYDVHFIGSFEGRGGTYTIDKLDISNDAVFILGVKGGDVETDSDDRLWMRFAGKALELTGDVTFFTDTDKISFGETAKIDPAQLEAVGNYRVTLTIDDANFAGSAVFEVVVTNENGYTERLEKTLARLRELKGDLTKETVQAKDFEALKEISALISALDEEELSVASEELAEYEELMQWWNDAADIGEAIETAEKLGDAPIISLFGVAAALTALVGLAYIAMKGGML